VSGLPDVCDCWLDLPWNSGNTVLLVHNSQIQVKAKARLFSNPFLIMMKPCYEFYCPSIFMVTELCHGLPCLLTFKSNVDLTIAFLFYDGLMKAEHWQKILRIETSAKFQVPVNLICIFVNSHSDSLWWTGKRWWAAGRLTEGPGWSIQNSDRSSPLFKFEFPGLVRRPPGPFFTLVTEMCPLTSLSS
jgi:hypothetical protein